MTTSLRNPYIFLLFKQSGQVTVSAAWNQTLNSRAPGSFEFNDLITEWSLAGKITIDLFNFNIILHIVNLLNEFGKEIRCKAVSNILLVSPTRLGNSIIQENEWKVLFTIWQYKCILMEACSAVFHSCRERWEKDRPTLKMMKRYNPNHFDLLQAKPVLHAVTNVFSRMYI